MTKHAVFLAAALLFAASCLAQSGTIGRAADEQLIRSIPDKIAAGWSKGDGRAIADVYAEGGTLVAGDGKVTQSRAEIARYHDQQFAAFLKGTRLTVEVKSLRFVSPDIAIMHTEGGILWPGEVQVAPRNRGVQSFVAVKNDGVWRITLFQNTRIRGS